MSCRSKATNARRYGDPVARFWSLVDRSAADGCWLWRGHVMSNGYGSIHFRGASIGAHRLAWMLTRGPLATDRYVCHTCDTPLCVRPDHLYPGTAAQNSADMHARGRAGTMPPERRLRGERIPWSRLNEAAVVEIRRTRPRGRPTFAALAARYGVAVPTISDAYHRKTWAHVP